MAKDIAEKMEHALLNDLMILTHFALSLVNNGSNKFLNSENLIFLFEINTNYPYKECKAFCTIFKQHSYHLYEVQSCYYYYYWLIVKQWQFSLTQKK